MRTHDRMSPRLDAQSEGAARACASRLAPQQRASMRHIEKEVPCNTRNSTLRGVHGVAALERSQARNIVTRTGIAMSWTWTMCSTVCARPRRLRTWSSTNMCAHLIALTVTRWEDLAKTCRVDFANLCQHVGSWLCTADRRHITRVVHQTQVQVEVASAGTLDSEETKSTARFCPASGAFHYEVSNRCVTMACGWVGAEATAAWECDATGLLRTLQLDDHESLVLETAVRTGFFLREEAHTQLKFYGAHAVRGGAHAAGGSAHVVTDKAHAVTGSAHTVSGGAAGAMRRGAHPGSDARDNGANVAGIDHDAANTSPSSDSNKATATDTPSSVPAVPDKASLTRRRLHQTTASRPESASDASVGTADTDAGTAKLPRSPSAPTCAWELGIAPDVTEIQLRVGLSGGQCIATVSIDPATWCVTRLRQRSMGAIDVWQYEGWRLWHDRFWFPARVSHYSADELVEAMAVESCAVVECNSDADASHFRRPPVPMWPPGAQSRMLLCTVHTRRWSSMPADSRNAPRPHLTSGNAFNAHLVAPHRRISKHCRALIASPAKAARACRHHVPAAGAPHRHAHPAQQARARAARRQRRRHRLDAARLWRKRHGHRAERGRQP